MRLIDANELRKHRCEHCAIANKCKNDEDQKIRCWSMKEISYMPTVEAIPVEWIKKYGVVKNEIVHTALENVLYWLIKDWEKENE